MGCGGRTFWDCTGLIMGCLGEESMVQKGKDLVDKVI